MSETLAASALMLKWIDLPPLWLLAFLIVGWVMPVLTGSPAWLAPLGAALALAGVAFAVWAVMEMGRARTTPIPHQRATALVTSGPFAFSRNPIYTADLAILLGVYAWWGQWVWAPFAFFALQWILTKRFIEPEEARLREDFGVAFGDWCSKTRRWL
ncbi:MAG: isoprenylcysteine carboxylmethyltransferase family protein [Pseudomonadota bacterium]